MQKIRTTVRIAGKEYTIASTDSEEYVSRVAAWVDRRMNELGIACEPVTSESMNHGWNMVQLDGSWYHLDATWDDPTSDMPLRARHQYFLLSNDGIEANEHTGWTCAQSATSTKYDSFFWANVNNPIPVVGDAMYYAEMNTTDYTRTLKKWDMSANTTTDVHTYSIASAAGRILCCACLRFRCVIQSSTE